MPGPLPEDMQDASVILLRRDVGRLNMLVRTRRWRSRSILIREMVETLLPRFEATFLPDCSVERANDADTELKAA